MTSNLPSSRWPAVLAQRLFLKLPAHVLTGLNTSLGLLLVTLTAQAAGGFTWALGASIGVVITSMPDLPTQPQRKLRELLPAACIGACLYGLVLMVRDRPLLLPMLLMTGSFLAVLPQAWGKRGVPLSSALIFSLVFPLAVQVHEPSAKAWGRAALFAAGGLGYLAWSRLTAQWLDTRFRSLALAETVDALATMLRLQGSDMRTPRAPTPTTAAGTASAWPLSALVAQQAVWTDRLQAARDLIFSTLQTAERRRLAAALLAVIEARDLLLACQLDLGALRQAEGGPAAVARLAAMLDASAVLLGQVAAALRSGAPPVENAVLGTGSWRDVLAKQRRFLRRSAGMVANAVVAGTRVGTSTLANARTSAGPSAKASEDASAADRSPTAPPLATPAAERMIRRRLGALQAQVAQVQAIVAGQEPPPAASDRPASRLSEAELQLFVSPVQWRWDHLRERLHWHSPIFRYAVRTALAMTAAYAIALLLPWGGHKHWVLVTVAVVLRSNYAQTADRRRLRLVGTAAGCLLAAVLLKVSNDGTLLFVAVVIAAGVSHGYATVRYAVTAAAASVLGLLQTHLLAPTGGMVVVERLTDTLIGIGIAWAFSFVLPVWERQQIPDLIRRLLQSHGRSAQWTLRRYDEAEPVDRVPEVGTQSNPAVDWRLARREVNDAQAALIAGIQRMQAEPRLVQLPMPTVVALLAHSQELSAQMVSITTLLVLRRAQLRADQIAMPLRQTAATLQALLGPTSPATAQVPSAPEVAMPSSAAAEATPSLRAPLPLLPPDDPDDRTPWLLQRLAQAEEEARRLVAAAAPLVRLTSDSL